MEKFGKIIKYTCFAVLMIVCAAIIIRICIMTDKSRLSTITPNDSLITAYKENSDIRFQKHDVYDEISKEGYFAAYALIYIDDIKQMQVTIRYNDSIYSFNDFVKDSEFTYYLYDSKNDKLIAPTKTETDEKLMYNYRRFVFDGVDASGDSDFYLYVAYDKSGEVTKDDCFDNLPIHYALQEWKNYSLSAKEKNLLLK